MKQRQKGSGFRKAVGILLVVLGSLPLAYFAVWATGAVIQWSFDIGLAFLLGIGLLLVIVGVLVIQGEALRWLARHKAVRLILFAALALFALSFAAVESMVLRNARLNNSSMPMDFVLIPGAMVVEDQPSLILKHRLDGAVDYLKSHPAATAVVSGAKGQDEQYTEAQVMKNYLISQGIEAARIVEEDKATNTIENVAFTKQIIDERHPGGNYSLMIVTSDFQMYRALVLARAQGIQARGISVPVQWSVMPICCAKEYFSILKLFLSGFHSEAMALS